jgi:tetratricopeptide (TPR) repeat protein
MLINFRNRYLGHGLTLDADASEKLWAEYFPIFRSLLEQMRFSNNYPMLKKEEGQTWLLQSSDIITTENKSITDENIWMQNAAGKYLSILPFFIVPGELAIQSSEKAKLFTYESYTGKTIKFFSPEGIEKQTSGKILDRLNLLLRDKQKEIPFTPETFTKEIFLKRIEEENKLLLDTLMSEKKIIPGVYQHRENMEIKLREWIGARANIFFIAAEAGSGKTNLLAEIQRQYTQRGYPGLLIRAGRMEKNTLKEQVAYLLNIDANEGLDKYTTIAGTQAEPSFILIDGLNEANNAESIWQEIIEWSKIIEPGSIKFVITSRANTKSDLERYKTEESDLNFLYGENKDNEKGLCAFAFWLTPLDMNEMKGAWENYVAKDKSRYKPQFSFDDIATFDRAIYNQINNPLVLRLFLEIYNGKNLPKKGGKHLHIWKDWFNTFSQEEQTFLKLLADEVWLKGENELLLDDLLNNEKLKPYLTSDLINSPYARMKNMGWVSWYVKDLSGCLGFTVEGALLYLLGVRLQEQGPKIDLAYIQTMLSIGTKLQHSTIESFLCEQSLAGDLDLVTQLIDTGTEQKDLCTRPLLYYLKAYGVEAMINKVLEEPTENDWKVLFELDKTLVALDMHIIRKDFLTVLMTHNNFQTKDSLLLGLKAVSVFDKELVNNYFSKIEFNVSNLIEDPDVLNQFATCQYKFGNFGKSIEYYEKCLAIESNKFGLDNHVIATLFYNIGSVLISKGDYDKALDYHQKSLTIRVKNFGKENQDVGASQVKIGNVWYIKGEYEKALDFFEESKEVKLKYLGALHPEVATSYNNIGVVWYTKKEYNKALNFYEKSLAIYIKTLGAEHPSVALLFGNIGKVLNRKGEYDKALINHEKSLEIRLKNLGATHPDVAISYGNIGEVWFSKGELDKALEYYEKCLAIEIKILGAAHLSVAISFDNIGEVWDRKGIYDKAIEYYDKSITIKLKNLDAQHSSIAYSLNNIASAWNKKGEYNKALECYQKSLSIKLKHLNAQHPDILDLQNIITEILKK